MSTDIYVYHRVFFDFIGGGLVLIVLFDIFNLRVVVAPEGSSILNEEGEEMTLKKATVGGHISEGMLCDGKMLGWAGGSVGVAVNLPDDFEIGSAPPASKPRPKGAPGGSEESAGPVEDGLFQRKLSKEEKKRLAKEKREARKAKKAAEE